MSTTKYVRAGKFLENLRVLRNDKKTAVSGRVRKSKEWVTRVEKGEFVLGDIEDILKAYDPRGRMLDEFHDALRQDVQEVLGKTSNQGVEVGV